MTHSYLRSMAKTFFKVAARGLEHLGAELLTSDDVSWH